MLMLIISSFVVLCSALSLPNGFVSYDHVPMNGKYPVETEATLGCNQGYNLMGANSRICLPSGQFHSTTSCQSGDTVLTYLKVIAVFEFYFQK